MRYHSGSRHDGLPALRRALCEGAKARAYECTRVRVANPESYEACKTRDVHSWTCEWLSAQTRDCVVRPEGTKRATSISVQLLRLRKNLRTGSISRDIVNFPSELCRRRSGIFTEAARLLPPGKRARRGNARRSVRSTTTFGTSTSGAAGASSRGPRAPAGAKPCRPGRLACAHQSLSCPLLSLSASLSLSLSLLSLSLSLSFPPSALPTLARPPWARARRRTARRCCRRGSRTSSARWEEYHVCV